VTRTCGENLVCSKLSLQTHASGKILARTWNHLEVTSSRILGTEFDIADFPGALLASTIEIQFFGDILSSQLDVVKGCFDKVRNCQKLSFKHSSQEFVCQIVELLGQPLLGSSKRNDYLELDLLSVADLSSATDKPVNIRAWSCDLTGVPPSFGDCLHHGVKAIWVKGNNGESAAEWVRRFPAWSELSYLSMTNFEFTGKDIDCLLGLKIKKLVLAGTIDEVSQFDSSMDKNSTIESINFGGLAISSGQFRDLMPLLVSIREVWLPSVEIGPEFGSYLKSSKTLISIFFGDCALVKSHKWPRVECVQYLFVPKSLWQKRRILKNIFPNASITEV
jgi:hypothetical protein